MSPQAWLDRVVGANADEEPCDLAEALWPLIGTPEFVASWLREKLEQMAAHPARLPAGYSDPVMQSLVMIDDGRVHASLAMVSAASWQSRMRAEHGGRAIIDFADGWTRLRFLVADGVVVQRHWRALDDGNRRAMSDPPQAVGVGQEFALHNRAEALRFTQVDADVMMIRLLVRDPSVERAMECDAHSGAVLRVRQAQSHESRMRMAISLLRSLGEPTAIAGIAQGLPHWSRHLRWHGVMEALALDSRAGFALLCAMTTSDPDPALRRQAAHVRATLSERYPDLPGSE